MNKARLLFATSTFVFLIDIGFGGWNSITATSPMRKRCASWLNNQQNDMITKEKIKIYKKYKGDVDRYIRLGGKQEWGMMDDKDFFLLRGLLQDLTMVNNGLTAESYSNSVNQRLIENCDGMETVEQIRDLVEGREVSSEENQPPPDKSILGNLFRIFKKTK